jgi:hypothetical protein
VPQTTVLQSWRATYPIQAPAQKPGGVHPGPVFAVSAATWLTGTVTLTTAAHGQPVNSQNWITVYGMVPLAYNGRYFATFASATTITYAKTPTPGAATTLGSATFLVLAANATPNAGMMQAQVESTEADLEADLEAGPEPKPHHKSRKGSKK